MGYSAQRSQSSAVGNRPTRLSSGHLREPGTDAIPGEPGVRSAALLAPAASRCGCPDPGPGLSREALAGNRCCSAAGHASSRHVFIGPREGARWPRAAWLRQAARADAGFSVVILGLDALYP